MVLCDSPKNGTKGFEMACRRKTVGWLAALSLGASLMVAVTASAQAAQGAQTASPGWRIAHLFGASAGVQQLDGVDAVSPTDAWLTGEVFPAASGQAPILVERWAAGTWHQVPVPASLDAGGLSIAGDLVGASSESNAWVFGGYQGSAGPFEVALGWNGTKWSRHTFPLWSSFNATAVFGTTDAWAFGENVQSGQPFVVRFDGSAWHTATVPVVPQGASALSPSDIWIVGPQGTASASTFAVARWDGTSWHTVDLPKLSLPTGTALASTDILALSPDDIWVTGSLQNGMGVAPAYVLLHLTSAGWDRVTVPYTPGMLSGISGDGHGGIWLNAPVATSAYSYFLHYAGGKWSRQLAPSPAGAVTEMNSISWAPGASSGWSGSAVITGDSEQGALLTYSP
jgi:hypothetical protein